MKTTAFVLAAALCGLPLAAPAGDDHNHGNEKPGAQTAASPRFDTHSDLFELVGVVEKGQMTLYLDRYATNEPIAAARIEYESGASKGIASPQPDGTYLLKFDALGKPGQLPLSFTVTAGSDTDLLAGELVIPDPHGDHDDAARPWLRWLGYAAGALAAIALAVVVARRAVLARTRKEFA